MDRLVKKNLTDFYPSDKVYEIMSLIEDMLLPENRNLGYTYESLVHNVDNGCIMALFLSDRVGVPLYIKLPV